MLGFLKKHMAKKLSYFLSCISIFSILLEIQSTNVNTYNVYCLIDKKTVKDYPIFVTCRNVLLIVPIFYTKIMFLETPRIKFPISTYTHNFYSCIYYIKCIGCIFSLFIHSFLLVLFLKSRFYNKFTLEYSDIN